jgi:uncharacterized protein YqjF (DUF2071 family)
MNETAAQPDGWRPLFFADWTRFIFIHYSLPPEVLSPYTPLKLDCRDGCAFVSLVFFRLEEMRPARFPSDRLGRILFRPASNNWFLNVRTYVRGGAGPGIQFLVEWMDNTMGLHLGPFLYGLPYRRGEFECPVKGPDNKFDLCVTDSQTKESLRVSVVAGTEECKTVDPSSLDGFLLEKYTAYTHRRGVSRYFNISHPHWNVVPGNVQGIDDTIVVGRCPWFKQACLHSAHAAAGFQNVAMGLPHRLRRDLQEGGSVPDVHLTPRFQ